MSLDGLRRIRGVDMTYEEPLQVVASGRAAITWPVIATVKVLMHALTARERDLYPEAEFRLLVAYRPDITARGRFGLVGTNRKFPLVGPPLDATGFRRELEVMAKELFA